MRLSEFTNEAQQSAPEGNLVTALELLRNRYKGTGETAKIRTQSLINLVLNTDKNFNYDALVAANENNPAVKNLIKSFNKNEVILNPADAEDSATTTNPPEGDATTSPVDTVDSMAKRAAKERNSDVF